MDEAEAELQKALAVDPTNQAALYYLGLIKQSKVEAPVESASNTKPAPNPFARTNRIYTSPQREAIYKKLNTIMFDKISYSNIPLAKVMQDL